MGEVSLYTIQKQGGWWVVRRPVLYDAEGDKPGRFRPRKGRTQIGAGTVIRGDEAEHYLRRGVPSVDAVQFPREPLAGEVEAVIDRSAAELAASADLQGAGANIRGIRRRKRISYKFVLGRFLSAAQDRMLELVWRGASDPTVLDRLADKVHEQGLLSAAHVEVASCVGFLVDRMADDDARFRRRVGLALAAAGLASARKGRSGAVLAGYKVEALVTAALLADAADFSGEYAILKNIKDSRILAKVRRYRPGVDDLAVRWAERARRALEGQAADGGDPAAVPEALSLLERLSEQPLEEVTAWARDLEAADPARYAREYAGPLAELVTRERAELSAILVLDELYADLDFLRARNEAARLAKYVYWGIRYLEEEPPGDTRIPTESRMLANLAAWLRLRREEAGPPVAGRGVLAALPSLGTVAEVEAFHQALAAYDRDGINPSADRAVPAPVRNAFREYLLDREVLLETRIYELASAALEDLQQALAAGPGEAPRDLPSRVAALFALAGPATPAWAVAAQRLHRTADFARVEARLRAHPGLSDYRFVEAPVLSTCRARAADRLVRALGGPEDADRFMARVEAAAAELAGQGLVLIVEDDPGIRLVEETVLGSAGLVVFSAPGWLDANAIQQAEAVDLLLLDLALPDVSGLDILRKLRSDPMTRELPVLVVSAYGRGDVVTEAGKLGADGFVVKPFDPATLVEKVQKLLAEGRPRRPTGGELEGSPE